MNKNLKLFALVCASILGTAQYIAAGLIDVNVKIGVGVATCTGANANCNVTTTVNAIGDEITVDVSAVPAKDKKDLDTITEEKLITIDLPANTGDLNIYQFNKQ